MVRHPHRSSRPAAVPTCLRLVVAVPCLRCSALDVSHSKSNYAMSVEIFSSFKHHAPIMTKWLMSSETMADPIDKS